MNQQKPKRPQLHNYAWYTSIALQMLAIILLSAFAGVKLDAWLKIRLPVFTITLSLAGVIIAIYQVTKDLLKKK